MGILMAAALVLLVSAAFAIALARGPVAGLRTRPRASVIAAKVALLIAAAIIAIEVGSLFIFEVPPPLWSAVVTDYFLAMANRIVGGEYAFFWTPRWIYWVGSLTPLIPIGAA